MIPAQYNNQLWNLLGWYNPSQWSLCPILHYRSKIIQCRLFKEVLQSCTWRLVYLSQGVLLSLWKQLYSGICGSTGAIKTNYPNDVIRAILAWRIFFLTEILLQTGNMEFERCAHLPVRKGWMKRYFLHYGKCKIQQRSCNVFLNQNILVYQLSIFSLAVALWTRSPACLGAVLLCRAAVLPSSCSYSPAASSWTTSGPRSSCGAP